MVWFILSLIASQYREKRRYDNTQKIDFQSNERDKKFPSKHSLE